VPDSLNAVNKITWTAGTVLLVAGIAHLFFYVNADFSVLPLTNAVLCLVESAGYWVCTRMLKRKNARVIWLYALLTAAVLFTDLLIDPLLNFLAVLMGMSVLIALFTLKKGGVLKD
jgi:hypothetical protein